MNIFKTQNGTLRNIWWVAIFFLVLAALTFPTILLSQHYGWEITIGHQAVIVIAANWICQCISKRPFSTITGTWNMLWLKQSGMGLGLGAVLMLVPALFLYLGGWVSWQSNVISLASLLSAIGIFLSVALAEEFLFRGFLFQRLMASVGVWGAQVIIAGYFLLTHINNPGMTGNIKILASINIFLASVMFGLAFIRTKSLAMPIGFHFMANWTQGSFLGFGVSGEEGQSGFFKPILAQAPDWLTGGTFGLEASLPGLISVLLMLILLYKWNPVVPLTADFNSGS